METKLTKEDAIKGGPGLDGYAFNADVYCVDCGQDIIRDLEQEEFEEIEFSDSEVLPQPIFFGEHEVAQHCGNCGEYLYGPQEERPSEGDYVMSPAGSLGGLTALSEYEGHFLGEFSSDEEAFKFARKRMEKEQFWPNVWIVSDHGNWTLRTYDYTEEVPE